MNYNFEDIFKSFSTGSSFISAVAFGSGNINDTFLVEAVNNGRNYCYFLQRINHTVFSDPVSVMSNTIAVTSHIRHKLELSGADNVSRRVLSFYPVVDQELYYYHDEQGNYWRLCDYITDAISYDSFDDSSKARNAAAAFGLFQAQMADFPYDSLSDVIPDFLNGQVKYANFLKALEADSTGRAAQVAEEIEYIKVHSPVFDVFAELIDSGNIPIRVTHNDAKINNVMLDINDDTGICVIDLDTVMPGIVHYDFGDMVRSIMSSGADIDPQLHDGMLDMEIFEAIADGYLSKVAAMLTRDEYKYLIFSARYMSLMLACRFLADYLAGDVYFKTTSADHNLNRCRSQIRLYQSLLTSENHMKKIMEKLSAKYKLG